jgi:hypothetical protein
MSCRRGSRSTSRTPSRSRTCVNGHSETELIGTTRPQRATRHRRVKQCHQDYGEECWVALDILGHRVVVEQRPDFACRIRFRQGSGRGDSGRDARRRSESGSRSSCRRRVVLEQDRPIGPVCCRRLTVFVLVNTLRQRHYAALCVAARLRWVLAVRFAGIDLHDLHFASATAPCIHGAAAGGALPQ